MFFTNRTRDISNLNKMQDEVIEAFSKITYVMKFGSDDLRFTLEEGLSEAEEVELTSFVESFEDVADPKESVRMAISGAISYFSDLVIDFSSDNVLMGITQANKTKDVSDFLEGVMKYGVSGSLYEVINEIDRIISNGIPDDLSPFVTSERLEDFKSRISNHLGS